MMCVYYFVFTELREGALPNFWVFLASGLFPFNFMHSNLINGSGLVVNNGGLVKKMYFPREILVLSGVTCSFIILCIGYAIVLSAIIISGYSVNFCLLLFLPIFLLVMAVFETGIMLFFSAVTVYVRDVQYVLNTSSMILYFMTPMYFVSSDLSGILANIIWLNPFTYYIEAFHSIVYFSTFPECKVIVGCILVAVLSIIIGVFVFNMLKKGFAERL